MQVHQLEGPHRVPEGRLASHVYVLDGGDAVLMEACGLVSQGPKDAVGDKAGDLLVHYDGLLADLGPQRSASHHEDPAYPVHARLDHLYLPLNSGSRFSRKALSASFESSVDWTMPMWDETRSRLVRRSLRADR